MDTFTTDGTLQPPGPDSVIPPLSNRTVMHYSFDMAQQIIKVAINNITIPVFIGALSIRPLSNQILFISLLQENAPFLVYIVKQFFNR